MAGVVTTVVLTGCGEAGVAGGILDVDAEGCVFVDDPDQGPRPLALPRGWVVHDDPVGILDGDGAPVVLLGEPVNGDRARFPWESGRVLCTIDGVEPIRFRWIESGDGVR